MNCGRKTPPRLTLTATYHSSVRCTQEEPLASVLVSLLAFSPMENGLRGEPDFGDTAT